MLINHFLNFKNFIFSNYKFFWKKTQKKAKLNWLLIYIFYKLQKWILAAFQRCFLHFLVCNFLDSKIFFYQKSVFTNFSISSLQSKSFFFLQIIFHFSSKKRIKSYWSNFWKFSSFFSILYKSFCKTLKQILSV